MKRNLSEQRLAWILLAPALMIVCGVIVYPLFETFIYTFKNMSLISASKGSFVGLNNYAHILTDSNFWGSLWKTVYFAVVSLTLELIIGISIALLLNENFVGKTFLRTIIIIPWAVPTIVNGSMWNWIYNPEYGALNAFLTQLGLIGSYQSWLGSPWLAMNMIIVADVWKMTPFVVIFALAALQLTNKSVYEAAYLDGAGLIKRFFMVTLPYLKPTLLVVIVVRTMDKFKVFDIIYATTRGGPADGTMVLTYRAYLEAFNNLNYSKGATYSYLIAFIIMLLTIVYVKVMKRGDN